MPLQLLRQLCRLSSALLLPLSLAAQSDVEARFAALEARVATLEAENTTLRTRLGERPATTTAAAVIAPAPTSLLRELRVAGYVQIHAEAGGMPDDRFIGIDDRFFIRRADVSIVGKLAANFAFKLETELSSGSLAEKSNHTAALTDAFVTWSPDPAFGLKLGQFKTPFGRAQLTSNTKLAAVERPLPSDRLTIGRQVGLAA